MSSRLLFYPVFNVAKTSRRISNPIIVHPASQYWIVDGGYLTFWTNFKESIIKYIDIELLLFRKVFPKGYTFIGVKDFLIRNKVEVLDPPMYADEDINPSNIPASPSLVMVRWDSITQQVSCEYAYVTSSMFIPLGSVATIQYNIAEPVNSNPEAEIKWFEAQENYTLNGISTCKSKD